jgi:GAF domain-containing protein
MSADERGDTGPSEADADSVSFPQIARLELDELLLQLIDRAQEVLTTQGRLRGLLAATRSIASDLSLPVVLRSITEAACKLVGAQYGALGVIGAEGQLVEFITVGANDQLIERIGHLPRGHGILGLLMADPEQLGLRDLDAHAASVGFSAGHPPMRSFVGVPIRVRDRVFGNLYLTEKQGGDDFSAEDEELLRALAAAAGVAIDNAHLYQTAKRRQRWLEASADVARDLASGLGDSLGGVAARARAAADADLSVVLVPHEEDPASLRVAAASGAAADVLRDRLVPRDASLAGQALAENRDLVFDDARSTGRAFGSPEVPAGPAVIVRVPAAENSRTALLCLTRWSGSRRFDAEERDLIVMFADQAGLAIQLAQAQEARRQLAVLEDRDRIAHALHEQVVRDLFGVELALDSLTGRLKDPASRHEVAELNKVIDATIRATRDSVYRLRRNDATS